MSFKYNGAPSVILSDTFDQWRMKTNEWLSMTNSAGSSNFIKINDTTNSTSNTTGAIKTLGGVGLGSSATIGGNLTLHTDSNLAGTTNFKEIIHILSEDADEFDHLLLEDNSTTTANSSTEGYVLVELPNYVDIDGAVQIDGAVTVGVDDTGYDVMMRGATSGSYMLWDASVDDLILAGDAGISIDSTTDSSNTSTGTFHTAGGVGIAKKLFVGTDLDVDGTTNLDAVDID